MSCEYAGFDRIGLRHNGARDAAAQRRAGSDRGVFFTQRAGTRFASSHVNGRTVRVTKEASWLEVCLALVLHSRIPHPNRFRSDSHPTGPSQRAAARSRRRSLTASRYNRSDRKSTRLNSSHSQISYAVFCLKKKKKKNTIKNNIYIITDMIAT